MPVQIPCTSRVLPTAPTLSGCKTPPNRGPQLSMGLHPIPAPRCLSLSCRASRKRSWLATCRVPRCGDSKKIPEKGRNIRQKAGVWAPRWAGHGDSARQQALLATSGHLCSRCTWKYHFLKHRSHLFPGGLIKLDPRGPEGDPWKKRRLPRCSPQRPGWTNWQVPTILWGSYWQVHMILRDSYWAGKKKNTETDTRYIRGHVMDGSISMQCSEQVQGLGWEVGVRMTSNECGVSFLGD